MRTTRSALTTEVMCWPSHRVHVVVPDDTGQHTLGRGEDQADVTGSNQPIGLFFDALTHSRSQVLRVGDRSAGNANHMTLNQQERQALTENWDQVKNQVKTRLAGVQDSDYEEGRSDPESFISKAAQKTGQSEDQVRQTLTSAAQQLGQGQSTQR